MSGLKSGSQESRDLEWAAEHRVRLISGTLRLQPHQSTAPDQLREMIGYRLDGRPVAHEDAQLHVSVERIVREVGAADERRVVNDRALGVQLAGAACLVRLAPGKGPVRGSERFRNLASAATLCCPVPSLHSGAVLLSKPHSSSLAKSDRHVHRRGVKHAG